MVGLLQRRLEDEQQSDAEPRSALGLFWRSVDWQRHDGRTQGGRDEPVRRIGRGLRLLAAESRIQWRTI